MCGIVGYVSNRDIPSGVLTKMLDVISHRGPDARKKYQSGPYRAGMCRLSINDLEMGGQPLFNHDRTISLLYNGEIYNSPSLRTELEAKGYVFRTRTDGEVICHLYDEYGEDLFERLDGMFAAALWDEKKQRLILARDLPGEKPLYYAELGHGQIAFASEIKALRNFDGLDLTLDRQAIWDFPTFLWIPEPRTAFNEIKVLPRGHVLRIDATGIHLNSYRNLFNPEPLGETEEEIIAETRRVVTEAVQSRLLSDVPVGSFLSGGLDSSIVAAIARRELGSIDTFSIGFEKLSDPYHGSSDESEYAAAYAARLGCRHHEIRVTAEIFRNDLDNFCKYGDQPFAVSSGLGIMAVARKARESQIKVLLGGDCADECFGGYSWYSHLPGDGTGYEKQTVTEKIVSFQNFGMKEKERLDTLRRYDAHERAWAWHYYAHEDEKLKLFSEDWSYDLKSSLRHFQKFDPAKVWSAENYIAQDRQFYMPNEMLNKVDRMTMAHSVEGRVPFAAPSVLAHADKLSFSSMVQGDNLKWTLRKAFSDILPEDIIARPKHGFNVPIDHWLKDEWKGLLEETFCASSALRKHGVVGDGADKVAMRMLHDPNRLNGHTIFSYLMLNRWLEGIY